MMKHTKVQRSAGFTLVELMVALTAGVLAITAVYSLSTSSSRNFNDQQGIAYMQLGLRMASQQIHKDIARAGFFTSPNSDVDASLCGARPPIRVSAIEFDNNRSTNSNYDTRALQNYGQNGVRADRIRMTGNYSTSDTYPAEVISGNTVRLHQDRQSIRASFFDRTGVYSEDLFLEAFAASLSPRRYRWLAIRSANNLDKIMFARIIDVDEANGTVQLQGNPLNCVETSRTVLVAPVTKIEYLVSDARVYRDGLNRRVLSWLYLRGTPTSQETAKGRRATVLIRRELDLGTNAPIPNTDQVVMQDVADFNFSFVIDSAAGVNPTQLTRVVPSMNLNDNPAEIGATPQRVRSVAFQLSMKAREANPNFLYIERRPGDPLTRYQPNYGLRNMGAVPAARVRTISDEVLLQNVAVRNLR